MKTILVPTDFSNASLENIHSLCHNYKDSEINLVFVHLFKLSDAIGDLLMLSRRSREYSYVSDSFYAACELLKNRFTNLKTVQIEFFYGNSMGMFKSFLEANEVTEILHPSFCAYSALNKNSMDASSFTIRCGMPLIKIETVKEKVMEVPVSVKVESKKPALKKVEVAELLEESMV